MRMLILLLVGAPLVLLADKYRWRLVHWIMEAGETIVACVLVFGVPIAVSLMIWSSCSP